jgi:DNA-binding transcriptional MerR regulator
MKKTPKKTSSTLQVFEPAPDHVYPIELVAHLTHTPRHLIAVYCRHGLIVPAAPPESAGWLFDEAAIFELRRLNFLRAEYGLEPSALRLMVDMHRELDQLRAEVRFLRGR